MKTVSVALLSTLWIAASLAFEREHREYEKKQHTALGVAERSVSRPQFSLKDLQGALQSIDEVPALCMFLVEQLEEQPYRKTMNVQPSSVRLTRAKVLQIPTRGDCDSCGLRHIISWINVLANEGLPLAQQRDIGYDEGIVGLLAPYEGFATQPLDLQNLQKRYAAVVRQCIANTWQETSPQEQSDVVAIPEDAAKWRLFIEQPAGQMHATNILQALACQILGQECIQIRTLRRSGSDIPFGAPYMWIKNDHVGRVREKLKLKIVEKAHTPAKKEPTPAKALLHV